MTDTKVVKNDDVEFLGVQEASKLIGVSADFIYKLTMQKRIPHYKLGKLLKFKRSEILQFMEGKRVEPCKSDYQ